LLRLCSNAMTQDYRRGQILLPLQSTEPPVTQ
jgi:hypothetical protein